LTNFALRVEKTVDIAGFLVFRNALPVVDVRSPAEYEHGHIPGAIHLPMLDNEERKIIGTRYKQSGRKEAVMEALELIGPKLSHYVNEFGKRIPMGDVLLHCWRGGMRSESTAWLLRLAGYSVTTLSGGYKSFRKEAQKVFEMAVQLHILGGKTGSGKTEILKSLESCGEQIVDLEALANHRGSVFGGLNMPPQPTAEQFENDLFDTLLKLDLAKPVWIEDESHAIGKVYLPAPFFHRKQISPNFQVILSREVRARRLVTDYGKIDHILISESLNKISKRLGGLRHQEALAALASGDLFRVAMIALEYYDKAYEHALEKNRSGPLFRFEFAECDPDGIAKTLRDFRKATIFAS